MASIEGRANITNSLLQHGANKEASDEVCEYVFKKSFHPDSGNYCILLGWHDSTSCGYLLLQGRSREGIIGE